MQEEDLDQQTLKAKNAIFQFIAGNGGIMSMKEAHDFSELNFGVGHKRFSDLMEFCVDNEYFAFNPDDRVITLLDKARNAL
jgi:hypothetical protein